MAFAKHMAFGWFWTSGEGPRLNLLPRIRAHSNPDSKLQSLCTFEYVRTEKLQSVCTLKKHAIWEKGQACIFGQNENRILQNYICRKNLYFEGRGYKKPNLTTENLFPKNGFVGKPIFL